MTLDQTYCLKDLISAKLVPLFTLWHLNLFCHSKGDEKIPIPRGKQTLPKKSIDRIFNDLFCN